MIFESYEAGFAGYLNQRIALLAALTIAASLLGIFLIPLLLRTSLFTPLRALANGMKRVESGNLDVSVRVQSRDEIGTLTRSFNRMVESIARAESSFRTLAEDARDGIMIFSNDVAVYTNRRAADMIGQSMSTYRRLRFGALFPSTVLPPYGMHPDAPVECFVRTAEGSQLPVELVYSPTVWQGGPATAVLVRDIARRKREEEIALRQQQSLMRMDKLTSLGVLAAGLAHEMNVPNQMILSNATLLANASPHLAGLLDAAAGENEGYLIAGLPAEEFRIRWPEMLPSIVKSSTLIDGIIRTLKNFSGESAVGSATLFDVNSAVGDAVELLGAYIKRATDRFMLDLQPNLPMTRGSSQKLEQVFINLILNACQATRGRDSAVRVQSRAGTAEATVQVMVTDEGTGIRADLLPRVREAFFTTRGEFGGTGLGLYVSDAIVTARGGTLDLVSSPGSGTEVTVTLPAEPPR